MAIEIRYIQKDEILESHIAVERAYGGHGDKAALPLITEALNDGRGVAAFDEGIIVGFGIAYPLKMNVGIERFPTTLLDNVAVLPTHRRRGILNRMMDFHMRDFYERGETLSGLGASESIIYGRYGYGIDSRQVDFSIDRRHTAFINDVSTKGKYSFINSGDALDTLPEVAERANAKRSGFIKGTKSLWKLYLSDPEYHRGDASELFHVVYEKDGQIDGYVSYRIRKDILMIHEMISATSTSHTALWRYCFGVDLMRRIDAPKRPIDDPLPWMLADPRRLHQSLRDDLWLRLVAVKDALSERSYDCEGRLVFEINDRFCPWNENFYELEGSPQGSSCVLTSKSSDISISAADLSSAYLGGITFTALARAGRAHENRQGSLALADNMFKTDLQPWWPNEF